MFGFWITITAIGISVQCVTAIYLWTECCELERKLEKKDEEIKRLKEQK